MANGKKTGERGENIAVRLKGPALAAVDAEVERLQREAPHFDPTRSDAVRSLLMRGASVVVPGGRVARGTLRVGTVVPLAEPMTGDALGAGGPVAVKGEV